MGFCGYGKLGLAQIITSPIKKGGHAYVLITHGVLLFSPAFNLMWPCLILKIILKDRNCALFLFQSNSIGKWCSLHKTVRFVQSIKTTFCCKVYHRTRTWEGNNKTHVQKSPFFLHFSSWDSSDLSPSVLLSSLRESSGLSLRPPFSLTRQFGSLSPVFKPLIVSVLSSLATQQP